MLGNARMMRSTVPVPWPACHGTNFVSPEVRSRRCVRYPQVAEASSAPGEPQAQAAGASPSHGGTSPPAATAPAASSSGQAPLSKNQQKKLAKRQHYLEHKLKVKADEKLQKKSAQDARRAQLKEALAAMTPEELEQRQKNIQVCKHGRCCLLHATMHPPTMCQVYRSGASADPHHNRPVTNKCHTLKVPPRIL